jgi:chemotaxis protein methyltransferase CheR
MNNVRTSAGQVELAQIGGMSDSDFAALAQIIELHTGIVINEAKRSMLVSRLSRRLRKLGLNDFAEYRRLLEGSAAIDERRELTSAITTNVTSFFREPVHFDALINLIPSFKEKVKDGNRIRIWSAGCSSGEEPYSIGMTLQEHWPEHVRADVRILATDIDAEMISTARRGAFTFQSTGRNIHEMLSKYMKPEAGGVTHEVLPEIKNALRFEELNLLKDWPFSGRFDVIFCRNVVIYFNSKTRYELWLRFADRLHAGGMLFIGHSERVDAELERYLEPCGVTQYQRTNTPVGNSR